MTKRSKYVTEFLEKNGLKNEQEVEDFLSFSKEDIPSGELILNSEEFSREIIDNITKQNRIVVFGDYDTDGALSTLTMVRSLQSLSKRIIGTPGKISYYINDRFIDGYGINKSSVDKLLLRNPKLNTIVTVDNGIVAFEAIDYARSKGLNVIVTDHHKALEDGTLPNANVIVDPNQLNDQYPFKGISGTTVAYKLMLNLYEKHFPEYVEDVKSLIDFVGVSVVSDMMPLREENRIYVQETLDIFNNTGEYKLRFGWYALKEVLISIKKLDRSKKITETDFGFSFSPIINAQSRVNGKANVTVDMFLSTDTTDVREKASYMVSVNEERKEISNAAFDRLNETDYSGTPIIIVEDDTLGEGLIGLLAGKLTEQYNRPSIVLTDIGNGVLKGSARSITNVDITSSLHKFDDLLLGMGGHAGAAGLSLKKENMPLLQEKSLALFETLIPKDLSNAPVPDLVVDADDLNIDLIDEFKEFAPFGQDFSYPIMQVNNMPIDTIKIMGKDKNHLKITSDQIEVIDWFGVDKFYDEAVASGQMDAVGKAEVNEFMNKKSVQIVVQKDALSFY